MNQRQLFAEPPKDRKPKQAPRYAVLVYDDFMGEWNGRGIVGGCRLWELRERIRELEAQGYERSMMRVERLGMTAADHKRYYERQAKFANVRKRDQ